jgi:hypothetical protein
MAKRKADREAAAAAAGPSKGEGFKKIATIIAVKNKMSAKLKATIEKMSFSEYTVREFKAGRLVVIPGEKFEAVSEAKLMLVVHDVWRVIYIAAYFYLFPFLALFVSTGFIHNTKE